jgi:hypothetical protein
VAVHGGSHKKIRKAFFFEKKKQKTFASSAHFAATSLVSPKGLARLTAATQALMSNQIDASLSPKVTGGAM